MPSIGWGATPTCGASVKFSCAAPLPRARFVDRWCPRRGPEGTPIVTENAARPASSLTRHPLFILFAIGSIVTVLGTSVVKKRDWDDFTARARVELARYPVVGERLGEITKITIDRERRASISNENQVAMDLFGTIDIGTIQVEIVDGAHGYELVLGKSLQVGDREFPLVEGTAAPAAGEPASGD